MTYRMQRPTMVLAFKDNHQAAVTIQQGQIIDLIGPVDGDDRFMLVSVNGEHFHVFASDLADRGKMIKRVSHLGTA